MEEREVRGAVLVGHSMSAMAGCIASVRRPDLFPHLVLLCASPRYINDPYDSYVGGFERSGIDGMLDAMSSDFEAWVRGFVPNAAVGGDAGSVTHLEKSFLAMHLGPGVALKVARMILLGDQRAVLDRVTAPYTVVQVKGDFAAPPCVAEYMQRRLTTVAAVEFIDSTGHFPAARCAPAAAPHTPGSPPAATGIRGANGVDDVTLVSNSIVVCGVSVTVVWCGVCMIRSRLFPSHMYAYIFVLFGVL
jgi:pimeloyl-ACP methyl ester carboxylesterase